MKLGRKRKSTGLRLLAMALVAALLFMALALGEDYAGRWLRQRREAAKKEREITAVEDTIVDYNRALTAAYKAKQAIILTELVTADELRRIDLYITYNYKKDQVLLADLNDIKFSKVSIKKKQATAKTHEQWTYKYVSASDSSKVIVPSKNATYLVDYKLEKAGQRWVVSSVNPRKS